MKIASLASLTIRLWQMSGQAARLRRRSADDAVGYPPERTFSTGGERRTVNPYPDNYRDWCESREK